MIEKRDKNDLFVILILTIAALPLHSQPLTLRQAINLALAHNQTILFTARESHASSQAAVAFVFVGTSAAAPGGDVKASPLFKRSLEESIAKLEGKATEAVARSQGEPMPTGRPGCPNPDLHDTVGETCEVSCSGTCGATCGGPFTCGGSTCGGETCSSTCANTCSGPTCGDTCTGTSCENYCVDGDVWRDGVDAYWYSYVDRVVGQYPLWQRWTNFNETGYYFLADISSAGQYLLASARNPDGRLYRGVKWLPGQGNPGTYHGFIINTCVEGSPNGCSQQ